MKTNLDQPNQDNLPRLSYEAPVVVDYGNAAELTQHISVR
jgi:hypothetical protein